MPRFRLAIVAALLVHSTAAAGPIAWSYSSTGASDWGYGFDPTSQAFVTADGGTQNIYLVDAWHAQWMVSPIPPQGPTLWTWVTLWDTASGEAYSFQIPVEFYDNEPSPPNVWDMHVPRIGNITPFDLLLGGHKYHVTQGPELALTVGVNETPEPGTLALAGLGLGASGLLRLRRRTASGIEAV
jgi:hypothetical protein